MPDLALDGIDGRDVSRRGGRGDGLRQLCSGRQFAHGDIAAVDCECIAIGHYEMLHFAVFQSENKVVALDVHDFRVPYLGVKRRLTVSDRCGRRLLRKPWVG